MNDDITHQDRLRGALFPGGKPPVPPTKDGDGGDEGSCAAFGFLRGITRRVDIGGVPVALGQQHVVSVFLAWPLAV